MPKVFVTNFASVDYEKLEEIGPVTIMTHGFVDLSDLQKFFQRIKPHLESSSKEDYLALSGSAAVSVVVGMLWLKYHGMVRMLTFNRRAEGYQEVVVTDTDIERTNQNA